ncbi:helix-turn-helix transcriptional regulator [Yersinia thracica]|uniref:helix-turn-helix transcriptional regulator n=1 Tax=Yersinia thracica TaxID=2890319 RepID=UPI00157D02A3|nr:LuxR C-terminal-related transcriptional regulator [Yersinia thracica]
MMNTPYRASVAPPKIHIGKENTCKLHRIAVIDSNYFRSRGLCALLSQLSEPSEVLCEVASVSAFQALSIALHMHINILIIHPNSFENQDLSGVTFLTQFLRTYPHCRVFMMADIPCIALLAIYHALGVTTMLSTRATLDVLQTSLRAGLLQTHKPTTQLPKLTPRELMTLQYLLAGIPVDKLARKLGISRKTIYTHRSNALQKLGLHRPQHMLDRNALLLREFIHQLLSGADTAVVSTGTIKQ